MKTHQNLFLALGILVSAQTASAATVYFSGYVNAVTITSQAGGFGSNPVQTGMLVTGSFEYSPAAPVLYSGGSSSANYAAYSTGILKISIDNTMHLSSDVAPGTYDHYASTTVWNRKTYSQDQFQFQTSGTNGFTDNFTPAYHGGTVDIQKNINFAFSTATYTALTNTSLPTVSALASSLFTSRTLSIEFNNGVDQPCGPTGEDFCHASNAYQIFTTITSVSTVPLPPSLFLMGSSLALLALGKHKRRVIAIV